MNSRMPTLLLGALLFPLLAPAQEPPVPELPKPPYVARAPDFAEWVVDVTQKAPTDSAPTPTPVPVDGAKPGALLPPAKVTRKSVVTKTGDVVRDVRYYTDGTSSQDWWMHSRLFREVPGEDYIVIIDPSMDTTAPNFGVSDFQDLTWIDLDHFDGTATKDGTECLVFRWTERVQPFSELTKLSPAEQTAIFYKFKGKPTSLTTAWVNKESRLPVAFEDEKAVYKFSFLKPPATPLVHPQVFQKQWEHYKGDLEDWKKHVMPRKR